MTCPTPPRVSVIVPVYNDPDGIRRMLDALAHQTYDAMQVVVVDNGSKPPLVELACGHRDLKIVRCPTPGAYAARNAGSREADGDILAFTDADCVPAPNWVEEGVRHLSEDAPAPVVVGGDVLLDPPLRRTGTGLYQYVTGFQQQENIERKGFSATANLFCPADLFRSIGPFEERLFSGADREWSWRAIRRGVRLVHASSAVVRTTPRTTLAGAIRQARRVAAGRRHLDVLGLTWLGPDALRPHRSLPGAILWILTRTELSAAERARVLAAAAVIKLSTMLERLRLCIGGRPERR